MIARSWIIAALALLVWSHARESAACGCYSIGPPCQAVWDADAVFAGTVRAIDVVEERVGHGVRHAQTIVHFDIERLFRNAAAGPVEIVTDDLSTCAYRFTRGGRYLVYAWKRDDGRFATGPCSRTRPLADAAEDLRYLEALPASGGTGARVYGRVTEWVHHPAEEHGVDHGPLEGMVVSILGAGVSRDVVTDRDGRYELNGIPPGIVSVSLMTPPGLRAGHHRDVPVTDRRACVAADFTVRAESAVHGIVLTDTGLPVAGVMVDAVAEELAGYRPKAFHSPMRTDAAGRFSFDRLPPGAYVFGVNITEAQGGSPSGPPTFLPGVALARDAAVFHLKPGDQINLGVLRLVNGGAQ